MPPLMPACLPAALATQQGSLPTAADPPATMARSGPSTLLGVPGMEPRSAEPASHPPPPPPPPIPPLLVVLRLRRWPAEAPEIWRGRPRGELTLPAAAAPAAAASE